MEISRQIDAQKCLISISGDFELNGISYNQKANANLRVTFHGTTQGFITLDVHKEAGFDDPDTQSLQARDRGPF